jgi:hypothetical protein
MSYQGNYMALQIRHRIAGPVQSFSVCLFDDVLRSFGNLDQRANEVANEYFRRIGAQPAREYEDVDMADVADDAQQHSISWYQMMEALRQAMLNLMASGLYHLFEQQLADSCRDGSFGVDPPRDTQLSIVADWYRDHFGLDLSTLRSWDAVNELRLVANAVKHSEGPAMRQLRARRPELFINPVFADVYQDMGPPPLEPVFAPLTGAGLFVTEDALRTYSQAAEAFFSEIAAYFMSRENEYFPF